MANKIFGIDPSTAGGRDQIAHKFAQFLAAEGRDGLYRAGTRRLDAADSDMTQLIDTHPNIAAQLLGVLVTHQSARVRDEAGYDALLDISDKDARFLPVTTSVLLVGVVLADPACKGMWTHNGYADLIRRGTVRHMPEHEILTALYRKTNA